MAIKRNLSVSAVVSHLEAMQSEVKRSGMYIADVVNGHSVTAGIHRRHGVLFTLGCFGVMDIDRIAAKVGMDVEPHSVAARMRIGNTPTCGLCDQQHGTDESCDEYAERQS